MIGRLALIALAGIVVGCGSLPAGHQAASLGSAASQGSASPGSSADQGSSASPGSSAKPVGAPSPAPTTRPASAASAVIAGTVSAGPISPVSRPGHANSRPVSGVRVEALRDGAVASVTYTDSYGQFRFAVQPGTYVIVPSSAGFRFAGQQQKTVTALAGREQTVDFLLDTGIR